MSISEASLIPRPHLIVRRAEGVWVVHLRGTPRGEGPLQFVMNACEARLARTMLSSYP